MKFPRVRNFKRYIEPFANSARLPERAVRIAAWVLLLVPTVAFAELTIDGIDPPLARNVAAFVALSAEPCDAEFWRVQRRFRTVEAETREALEPFGYYQPTISKSLSQSEDCWTATLKIEPGPQVQLRNVDISITGDAASDSVFREKLPRTLTVGAPLRHRNYEQYKQVLQANALDRGYLEASFEKSQLDIWPEALAADVSLSFDSGARYAIGDIMLDQTAFEPSLVSRYLNLQPGEPYDGRELSRAYRDLSDSGYFRRVDITPEFDRAANGRIPISVMLEPVERYEYTIGAGFATDTGPRFRSGFRNRRFNSRGHRINADLRVSPVISGLSGEYRQPLRDPRSDWMSYTGSIDQEVTDTFDNDTLQLGLRRSKRLSASWIRTYSFDYSYERFTVATVADTSRLILPAVAFDHISADRDLYPSKGRRFGIEIRAADEALGSTTSFQQAIARLRWVTSFGDNTRLLLRATAGFTSSDALQELPPSVRFFAGGDESVRGFGYETLGPRDVDGNVIGGSNLLVASVEAERHVRGNFYGAVFVDAGNAFDGTSVNPAVGAGFGLKWRSPVGPLRIYLAHPLNKSSRSVRLHVSLGSDL